MRSDLTRYFHGARDPAAREARRRYERDRRFAIEVAEEHATIPYMVQYTTPDGVVATCDRDLAVVFAGLVTEGDGRGIRRTGSRMRDRVRGDARG